VAQGFCVLDVARLLLFLGVAPWILSRDAIAHGAAVWRRARATGRFLLPQQGLGFGTDLLGMHPGCASLQASPGGLPSFSVDGPA
jgi:hypothetical protein